MSDKDFVIKDGILKAYSGNGGNVVIPEGVTSIDRRAFINCNNITSLTIPEGGNQNRLSGILWLSQS